MMDELSKIAKAYYKAGSDHHKKLAHDFFNAMDEDEDGQINRKEFIEFMKDQGHDQLTRPSFFKQLDLDGNGTLDFDEVMTLYYIIKSGRPFCDNCKMFIPTTYFMCRCVGCLEDAGGGLIHLCLDCYTKQKCDHSNNDVSRFLDNYSLLEVMRNSTLSKAKSRPTETVPSSDNPPLETWNAYSSMLKVSNWVPGTVNHHSSSQCPWTSPLQYPPYRNNDVWNRPLSMVQVSNWPPPVNHHSSSQCPPTVPHQYPPLRNNQPWNPVQVPNIPYSSIANHQCAPSIPFQNVAPQVLQQTWNQHTYHHHPPIASNAIVPQRERWKEAFEALNVALSVAALGGALCSIL